MASPGGVSFTKFFFYAGDSISPARKQQLVALAYATARDMFMHPEMILIRQDIHDSTTINGKRVKDPKGWHGTFAFKDSDQVRQRLHVATHGYTSGRGDYTLREASHSHEKPDSTSRGKGRIVWPDEEDLVEYQHNPIAYSHLPHPDGTQPHENEPDEAQTYETQPHGPHPHEPQPHGPHPHEPQPHGTHPHEPQPHGTHPHEPQPHGTHPHEPEPFGTQPDETHPHETQPHGTQPNSIKSHLPHLHWPHRKS